MRWVLPGYIELIYTIRFICCDAVEATKKGDKAMSRARARALGGNDVSIGGHKIVGSFKTDLIRREIGMSEHVLEDREFDRCWYIAVSVVEVADGGVARAVIERMRKIWRRRDDEDLGIWEWRIRRGKGRRKMGRWKGMFVGCGVERESGWRRRGSAWTADDFIDNRAFKGRLKTSAIKAGFRARLR